MKILALERTNKIYRPIARYVPEKAMAPHSCLENPMDGGAWWAAVHGVTQSQT